MSSGSAASAGAGKAAPEPPLLTHKDKALHSIALLKTLKEGGVDAVGVYIDQLEVKVQMLKKLKQWLGLSHEVVENLMDRPFYDRQALLRQGHVHRQGHHRRAAAVSGRARVD
jgi:hypothetical protein